MCASSRIVFVNFERVENAVPAVVEIEDRHVKHKHRIVPLPIATKLSSRFGDETPLASFQSCFSSSKELELTTVDFTSGIHSFCVLVGCLRFVKELCHDAFR